MALQWSDARVVATCGDAGSAGADWPKDTIVVMLRPEEVEDSEAIDSLRDLVLDRTIAVRQEMIDEIVALGASLPEPEVIVPEGTDESVVEAERRLLKHLMEDDDVADLRDGYLSLPVTESGSWIGQGGTGVRIFVGHVDELVVHN